MLWHRNHSGDIAAKSLAFDDSIYYSQPRSRSKYPDPDGGYTRDGKLPDDSARNRVRTWLDSDVERQEVFVKLCKLQTVDGLRSEECRLGGGHCKDCGEKSVARWRDFRSGEPDDKVGCCMEAHPTSVGWAFFPGKF